MTLADDLAAAFDLLDRLDAAMRTVDPDGRNLHDTVVFYRQLARPGA